LSTGYRRERNKQSQGISERTGDKIV